MHDEHIKFDERLFRAYKTMTITFNGDYDDPLKYFDKLGKSVEFRIFR